MQNTRHNQNTVARNEADTRQLAVLLAQSIVPGDVIYLEGDLGTGKTFFSQALIAALGFTGKVLSPTYSLVNSYPVSTPLTRLHHFDLYRLTSPEELEYIGIRDYCNQDDVCLIEWPSKGVGIIPPASITITLKYGAPNPAASVEQSLLCQTRLLSIQFEHA